MAQELSDYIFNDVRRPNKTGVLLAIPMYMYRIETSKIEYGINFFQKAVLKFKTKPGIDNETIAGCLGLDKALVDKVIYELKKLSLLTKDGLLTDKGKELKNNIDGLVIDEKKKAIGYVFQHINDSGLYQYYVNKINKASVLNGQICTGSKGENGDEDFYVIPTCAEKLLDNKVINPTPGERDIMDLIIRSNKHCHKIKVVESDFDLRNLSISFIPNDHPIIVWICVYAYLPRIKDDIYKSQWQIRDPFGFENNSKLKIYVENLLSNGLIDDFTINFNEFKTEDGQQIDKFQAMMEKCIDAEMDKTFEIGYVKLDNNILQYLRAVVKSYLLLNRTIQADDCGSFIGNIQNVYETMFKLEFENNELVYDELENNSSKLNMNKRHFADLFTFEGFEVDETIKITMIKFSRNFNIGYCVSLKHYLMKFLLAYRNNKNNPLYPIIKNKVGAIYTIAGLRNLSSHGRTSTEGQINVLTVKEINKYYNDLKEIINNYITSYNG